jgi:hypothetical protein
MSPRLRLRQAWELRNAAATTLLLIEEQLRSTLAAASAEDIVALLDDFSPARSPGPEWTRSFDPLVERLWMWCDPHVLAAVKTQLDARGSAWAPLANALAPEYGQTVRATVQRGTAPSRLPSFTLA